MIRLLKRVGLGSVAVLTALALLNALFALGERLAYGARWQGGRPEGLYLDDRSAHPRLRPGAQLDGLLCSIHVNSMGFRGGEIDDTPASNALRVWFMGGSSTFDIMAPDDDATWPAQAGARLQEALPDRRVEVVNAGIPGEILAGNCEELQRWSDRVRPDYVVIYAGPNDLRRAIGQLGMGAMPRGTPLAMGFALTRTLQRWLVPYRRLDVRWAGSRVDDATMGNYRQRIEETINLVRSLQSRPVLATHGLFDDPTTSQRVRGRRLAETCFLFQQDPDGVADTFRRANEAVVRLAADRDLPLADIAAAVPPSAQNWGDAVHFVAPGSRIAGQVVADTILADLSGR